MSDTFDVDAAIAHLEAVAGSVPGFEPADSKIWREIVRKGSHPDEYIHAAADLIDASDELRRAAHFEASTARDGVQLSLKIRQLITQAEVLLNGLRFTDAKLRASLVDGCNRVYVLAPGVARSEPGLDSYIEAMRTKSRRSGGRKKGRG
jgi:hypothetical protein